MCRVATLNAKNLADVQKAHESLVTPQMLAHIETLAGCANFLQALIKQHLQEFKLALTTLEDNLTEIGECGDMAVARAASRTAAGIQIFKEFTAINQACENSGKPGIQSCGVFSEF